MPPGRWPRRRTRRPPASCPCRPHRRGGPRRSLRRRLAATGSPARPARRGGRRRSRGRQPRRATAATPTERPAARRPATARRCGPARGDRTAPSLRSSEETCDSTVRSESTSRSAICALVRLSPTSASTSASRREISGPFTAAVCLAVDGPTGSVVATDVRRADVPDAHPMTNTAVSRRDPGDPARDVGHLRPRVGEVGRRGAGRCSGPSATRWSAASTSAATTTTSTSPRVPASRA